MNLFHPVARPQPPPPPPPPPPPTHLSMNFWKIFPLKLSQISTMYGCKGGETHKQHLRPGFSQWTYVSKSSVYCSGGWTGPRVTDVQILFGSALLKASAAFPFVKANSLHRNCHWTLTRCDRWAPKTPLCSRWIWNLSNAESYRNIQEILTGWCHIFEGNQVTGDHLKSRIRAMLSSKRGNCWLDLLSWKKTTVVPFFFFLYFVFLGGLLATDAPRRIDNYQKYESESLEFKNNAERVGKHEHLLQIRAGPRAHEHFTFPW